jgi:hypothetical protein
MNGGTEDQSGMYHATAGFSEACHFDGIVCLYIYSYITGRTRRFPYGFCPVSEVWPSSIDQEHQPTKLKR